MTEVTITFPDGNKKAYPAGSTPLDIATSISEGLARATLAANINGTLQDANTPINEDSSLELLTYQTTEGREVFWHSSAHVLAQAIKRLYPEAQPTIGPPLEEGGFYYDFANLHIKEEDLEKIEEEMKKIAKENHESKRKEYANAEEAKNDYNNKYKHAIIDEAEGNLSAYQQGEFLDFCRGPHIPRTGLIKAIKLTKISGAYWRGDSKNEQLTRIYGITFPDKKLLKQHLELLAEAKKRDHRIIGKKLDLYGFEETSPGSPYFYPRGTIIYNELLTFLRKEYQKRGYEEVITPLLYEKQLWETSGHWNHYKEHMYLFQEEEQTYGLKPMNCPGHCLVYNRAQHSYKELPVRIADFAALHRDELRGVLGGLTRVRKFSQDDAHIFCTHEQIKEEIKAVIEFTNYIYQEVMDMTYDHVELSTRPEKFIGDIKTWDEAEENLKQALNEEGVDYVINEGDGAFYGPKIDFHIRDAIGRTWQTATIQLDFNMPQRFACTYVGEDSKKHEAVMIHRALLGSLERFIGVLIEHYAGKLPLWLSPEQTRILTITDKHEAYAEKARTTLEAAGIRATVDTRNESLNKKVRDAQLDYIPYILVVGDNEAKDQTVTVRTRDGEVHGAETLTDYTKRLQQEISQKQ